MQGKAHIATALATTAVVNTSFAIINNTDIKLTLPIGIVSFFVSGISALLPDIDLPTSLIGSIPGIHLFSKLINKLFGHRTITHSGLWMILYFILLTKLIPINTIQWWVVFYFLIGFATHLIADTITKSGVPWLYPIIKHKFHVTNVKSGIHDGIFGTAAMLIVTIAVVGHMLFL